MRSFEKSGRCNVGLHVLKKVLVLIAFFAAAGCGMQPYDPPNNREYPAGPGMFSGKDGEFVIYREKEPVTDSPADELAAENAPTDENEGSEQPQ